MVDAYDETSPTGGDLVEIPAELQAIKERMNDQFPGKMDRNFPVQRVYPAGSSGTPISGSHTVNLANGTMQSVRVAANVSLTFTVPSISGNYVPFFVLRMQNGGSYNVNWPAGTRFPYGAEPVLTNNGIDMLVFYKPFVNANYWEGILVASDMKEP